MSRRHAPLFIVGPSRSGTTLLAACLNTVADVHVGAETHYFDDLRPRMGERAREPLRPEDAELCETYFMALAHAAYGDEKARSWKPEDDTSEARVERGALRHEAARLGPGSDAWFEAFCWLQARAAGKERWGEKTPRHVFRMREILERWPEARILCLLRDPRAVVASYRSFSKSAHREGKARFAQAAEWAERDRQRIESSRHPAVLALLWRGAARAGLAAAAEDSRVRVMRYEDLVADPEGTMGGVCAWLGSSWDPARLADVPQMNSSFSRRSRGGGISRDSLELWRERLDPRSLAVVQAICRHPMSELGYQPEPVDGAWGHLLRSAVDLPVAVLQAVRANRDRIASLPDYLARRLGPGLRRR